MKFNQSWYTVMITGYLFLFIPFDNLAQQASTQNALDSLYSELELIFDSKDSTYDFLLMVDSMLMQDDFKYHAAMARFGYLGEITTAGRENDVPQYGLSAGFTYFHPSGIFADVNGLYNSAYQPKYFLTTLSAGYFKTLYKHWNFSLSHDFYLYNDTLNNQPFNKAVNISNFYSSKYLDAGIDYSFLYGSDLAHRLYGNLSLNKKWKFSNSLSGIRIFPGVSFQFGNSNIIYWKQSDNPYFDLIEIIQSEPYPELERRQILYLTKLLYEERYTAAVILLRRNSFTGDQIQEIVNTYNESQIQSDNVFGLMNISLQFPISLSLKSFNLMMSYTHNFPQALPNEPYDYPDNGFISISLSYFFFKIKNNDLMENYLRGRM